MVGMIVDGFVVDMDLDMDVGIAEKVAWQNYTFRQELWTDLDSQSGKDGKAQS